jgi:GT2 family glycosyltransferase
MNYTINDVTVVIFANSKTSGHLGLIKAIADKTEIPFIIFEQNRLAKHKYPNCTTIYKTEPFNFNKFCNDAIEMADTDLVLICNNDLVPENGWIEELVKSVNVSNLVVSSHDPLDQRQKGFTEDQRGYECGKHFSGWCFMFHKKAIQLIGAFDEDFPFWCADNAFLEQLRAVGIVPRLVYNSKVRHLGSRTLKSLHAKVQQELTRNQIKKFNRKYDQNLFNFGK